MNRSHGGSHAVVIGGSMAGLLAARVLADHFDQVTILERDRYGDGPVARKGAPQARHAHVLLKRGQDIVEQLFPGLSEELAAAAPQVDAAEDIAWLTPAGWSVRCHSGINLLSASRDLLEWAVRRRVAAVSGIHFMQEVDVTGLATDDGEKRVTGVSIRRRDDRRAERLSADLVVDASGRGSHAPAWLEALGYSRPAETVVNSFLGYASRLYRCPADFAANWKALYLQGKAPDGNRGGLILPIEGNRWIVTLSGRGGDYPPTDEARFIDFAHSLPSPELHDAIKDAEPLSPISGFRATENRLRHFEKLPRWPEGFVALGDAACAFNPVYGQGMTTAALGAVTLGDCLRRHGHRSAKLARKFQQRLAQVIAIPWMLATSDDCRYPDTVGAKPGWMTRLRHRFVDRFIELTTRSAVARIMFLKVIHLLKPPASLFRPGILWSMLVQRRKPVPECPISKTSVAGAVCVP